MIKEQKSWPVQRTSPHLVQEPDLPLGRMHVDLNLPRRQLDVEESPWFTSGLWRRKPK
jgi:hypothetical protein